MSSVKQPGNVDIAVICSVLGLVFMLIMVYLVSRCFCRHRNREDETSDNVRSLERIHNSASVIPFDNRGFIPVPPKFDDVGKK